MQGRFHCEKNELAPRRVSTEVLSEGGYLDPMSQYDLDEFFIEEFYFDFMWIEATHNLLTSTWFQDFENKIEDFKINQHIPMVMISYQDC